MSHTYNEIRSQPAAWRKTVSTTTGQWGRITQSIALRPETQFLLVGSGASLYIARTAAHSLQETTGHVARPVASSEVFLSSSSIVPRELPVIAFVISRSGETSEALLATGHLLESNPNVTVVAVTCNSDTTLEGIAHHAVNLTHTAERSVVMTGSFTSMLLALQVIAGLIGGDQELLARLGWLPDFLHQDMTRFEEFGKAVGQNLRQDQFIYLGLGPNEGLAEEATLMLKEMTQTTSEAYNPLEFRHGPISIVREGTTVVILEGLRERAYVANLEADLKQRGATVAAIGPYAPAHADLNLRLPGDLPDIARCLLYMPPLQLAAYHRAVAAGLDPDQPRSLTQVVVLSDVDPKESPA